MKLKDILAIGSITTKVQIYEHQKGKLILKSTIMHLYADLVNAVELPFNELNEVYLLDVIDSTLIIYLKIDNQYL